MERLQTRCSHCFFFLNMLASSPTITNSRPTLKIYDQLWKTTPGWFIYIWHNNLHPYSDRPVDAHMTLPTSNDFPDAPRETTKSIKHEKHHVLFQTHIGSHTERNNLGSCSVGFPGVLRDFPDFPKHKIMIQRSSRRALQILQTCSIVPHSFFFLSNKRTFWFSQPQTTIKRSSRRAL